MADKPALTRFVAQVARIRIETTIVDINIETDATDDEGRETIIENAEFLPRRHWKLAPFDAAAYRPHIQDIVCREEIEEAIADCGTTAPADMVDAREQTRYLLLKADCDTAEGEVIMQPWLDVDDPNLLTSDLCRAWIDGLERLGLTYMSDRLDDLAGGSQPTAADQILFGAKPKKKPET
jgi:hypothetical protein